MATPSSLDVAWAVKPCKGGSLEILRLSTVAETQEGPPQFCSNTLAGTPSELQAQGYRLEPLPHVVYCLQCQGAGLPRSGTIMDVLRKNLASSSSCTEKGGLVSPCFLVLVIGGVAWFVSFFGQVRRCLTYSCESHKNGLLRM